MDIDIKIGDLTRSSTAAKSGPALSTESLPKAGKLSRKQVQNGTLVAMLAARKQWQRLAPQAHATWPAIPASEIDQSEGNFHRLAGMVQLYCRENREEADRQVKAFLSLHAAST